MEVAGQILPPEHICGVEKLIWRRCPSCKGSSLGPISFCRTFICYVECLTLIVVYQIVEFSDIRFDE